MSPQQLQALIDQSHVLREQAQRQCADAQRRVGFLEQRLADLRNQHQAILNQVQPEFYAEMTAWSQSSQVAESELAMRIHEANQRHEEALDCLGNQHRRVHSLEHLQKVYRRREQHAATRREQVLIDQSALRGWLDNAS